MKDANIIVDISSAFGTIVGLILTAISKSGPMPSPEKKANPSSIDSLRPRFLPLSGVKNSPKASAAPKSANPIVK